MKEIVLTLVFSIVLLLIMLYPAIRIAGYIEDKKEMSQRVYLVLTLLVDIVLSLIGGVFLSYF
jgi:hypothetical protein